jgi:S-adenosylmethionine hydrolase
VKPVVTLLTDFGTADYFVAAVKGVILTINPLVSLVDITHEIPPQDIEAGAFTLLTCYRDFPPGTIHLAVVDPGVGSTRRAIVVSAGAQFFVGPDNGLFSYVYDREASHKAFHVTAKEYFRSSPSPTFHGRDIFGPVAAALSNGLKPKKLGPRIGDQIRLPSLSPVKEANGKLRGRIIHIDHFGNCITNFTRAELAGLTRFELRVKRKVIREVRSFFAEGEGPQTDCNQIFAIWGSAGFLEIAINGGSAAEALQAQRGEPVIVST